MSDSSLPPSGAPAPRQLPAEVSIVLGGLSLTAQQLRALGDGGVVEIPGADFPRCRAFVAGDGFAEVELVSVDGRPALRVLERMRG